MVGLYQARLVCSRRIRLFGVMWESSIQDPNPVDFGLPPGDITTPASSGVCASWVLMGGNILRGQTCQLRGGAVDASRFNGDQLAILTNTSRCDVRGEAASAVAGRWVLRACRFGRRDVSGVLVLAERRVEQGWAAVVTGRVVKRRGRGHGFCHCRNHKSDMRRVW